MRLCKCDVCGAVDPNVDACVQVFVAIRGVPNVARDVCAACLVRLTTELDSAYARARGDVYVTQSEHERVASLAAELAADNATLRGRVAVLEHDASELASELEDDAADEAVARELEAQVVALEADKRTLEARVELLSSEVMRLEGELRVQPPVA